MGIPEVSHGAPSLPGVKRRVPPSAGPPVTAEDHGSCDSAAAFFKESMRRDAMIGMKVVHALWDVSRYESRATSRKRGTHTPGKSWILS